MVGDAGFDCGPRHAIDDTGFFVLGNDHATFGSYSLQTYNAVAGFG